MRLEALISGLHPILRASCSPLGAAVFVVAEYPPSTVRDMVVNDIAAMAAAQRELCRCFNNLRSRVGTLEREQGNPSPEFYEGAIRFTGALPVAGCTCGFKNRTVSTGDNTNGIVNT